MRKRDKQPPRTKKYYRSTKSGAGMTKAGVARYRRENPGSKLKTAVTKKSGLTAREKARRKSYCARSAGQMKRFPKAAKDPNSRLRQARRRWRCQLKRKTWVKRESVRLCGICEECSKELLSNEGGWIITASKKYFCHDGRDGSCFDNYCQRKLKEKYNAGTLWKENEKTYEQEKQNG